MGGKIGARNAEVRLAPTPLSCMVACPLLSQPQRTARPTSGTDAVDLGARQPLRPLRDRYGDEVAAQLILVAAGDTNVGITPIERA